MWEHPGVMKPDSDSERELQRSRQFDQFFVQAVQFALAEKLPKSEILHHLSFHDETMNTLPQESELPTQPQNHMAFSSFPSTKHSNTASSTPILSSDTRTVTPVNPIVDIPAANEIIPVSNNLTLHDPDQQPINVWTPCGIQKHLFLE